MKCKVLRPWGSRRWGGKGEEEEGQNREEGGVKRSFLGCLSVFARCIWSWVRRWYSVCSLSSSISLPFLRHLFSVPCSFLPCLFSPFSSPALPLLAILYLQTLDVSCPSLLSAALPSACRGWQGTWICFACCWCFPVWLTSVPGCVQIRGGWIRIVFLFLLSFVSHSSNICWASLLVLGLRVGCSGRENRYAPF